MPRKIKKNLSKEFFNNKNLPPTNTDNIKKEEGTQLYIKRPRPPPKPQPKNPFIENESNKEGLFGQNKVSELSVKPETNVDRNIFGSNAPTTKPNIDKRSELTRDIIGTSKKTEFNLDRNIFGSYKQ